MTTNPNHPRDRNAVEARELRIGNYVKVWKSTKSQDMAKVSIEILSLIIENVDTHFIDPIRLSSVLLEMFGFTFKRPCLLA